MVRKLIPVLLVLALSTIACGVSIPINTVTPGPLVTDPINVPLPAGTANPVELSLAFGAGTLKSTPVPRAHWSPVLPHTIFLTSSPL